MNNRICDISKHQGAIDWDALAPALDFAVIKASGLYANGADPYYARNVEGAVSHGIPFHAYHFLYCTTEAEARRDAGLFYRTVRAGGHMPLFWVLDCEAAWGVKDRDAPGIAAAFERELRRLAGQDIRVALYVAHQKYAKWAFDYDRFAYVWIPRYGKNDGTEAGGKRPDYPCDLWQYTSKGRLPGIGGDVDLNALMGARPMEYFTGIRQQALGIRGGGGTGENEALGIRQQAIEEDDKTGEPEQETGKGGEVSMLTGKQLAEYCEKVYKAGWVYWYGTYGNKCTESLYNSKKKQYPQHYTSARAAAYRKDIAAGKTCADCVGLIKSFFWTGGQFGAVPKYGSNNCPDKSADGMIGYCSETGPIKSMPDEPGLVVWKSGHIGVYVGGGYTVEMKGFDYDCKRNRVEAGPWTKWGRLPKSMIEYDEALGKRQEALGEDDGTGDRQQALGEGLSKGDYGSAVEAMQRALLKWDPKCLPKYGADGDFGSETEKAVRAYQAARGLPVTGVYDAITREALTTEGTGEDEALGIRQQASGEDVGTADADGCGDDACPIEPEPVPKTVRITGGTVNVRSAPGTSGTRVLGVVKKGEELPWQGEDRNVEGREWHSVSYGNKRAWISGKYSEVI